MDQNVTQRYHIIFILNGIPGKVIKCRRGVRQGDPYSPLLYVMVAELLQILVNKAWQQGEIKLPVEYPGAKRSPTIQYAGDTLIIMPADPTQLMKLREILEIFSSFTGLKVNYSKSSIVPINIRDTIAYDLANIIGCKTESMPFTYLGLPMGPTRPKVDDLMPMVSMLDRRMSGIAGMMSYLGRLVHLKASVAALPIFAMSSIRVPFTILDHYEKSGRSFLWYGNEINKQGKCLVNWETVCLTKKSGGLGVLVLRKQNRTLLVKFMYKFFNKQDIPWVEMIWDTYYSDGTVPTYPTRVGSFWWRDCCAILDDFKEMAICKPAKGNTVLLWKDVWQQDTLVNTFPQLHSFAKEENITIANAIDATENDFYSMFHLPMSSIAVQQSQVLYNILRSVISRDNNDTWQFKWQSKHYSNKRIYLHLIRNPRGS